MFDPIASLDPRQQAYQKTLAWGLCSLSLLMKLPVFFSNIELVICPLDSAMLNISHFFI